MILRRFDEVDKKDFSEFDPRPKLYIAEKNPNAIIVDERYVYSFVHDGKEYKLTKLENLKSHKAALVHAEQNKGAKIIRN